MKLNIPIKVKASGTGKSTVATRQVICIHADTCPVKTCPHAQQHRWKIAVDGYRCDQYKRKDLAQKRCDNPEISGAYCVDVTDYRNG